MSERKCRKCHECSGNSHHWIPNSRVGITENEPSWVCKHCQVKGEDCPTCSGFGCSGAPPDGGDTCLVCRGEGVLSVEHYGAIRRAARIGVRRILERLDGWEAEAEQEAQKHQLPAAGTFVMEGRLSVEIENAICEYIYTMAMNEARQVAKAAIAKATVAPAE